MKHKPDGYDLAIVGATGAVGREMLQVLEDSTLPTKSVRLFASSRSVGEELSFADRTLRVEALPEEAPDAFDLALFSAGSEVSREHAPRFAEAGAVVIDNSSAWRGEHDVPLVVPEVNGERAVEKARQGPGGFVIANPNCSTIQLVVALAPLHRAFGLQRVIVSTYQSVSGAGHKGIDELSTQVVDLFNNRPLEPRVFPHQIAFNLIPAIGDFRADGYTTEEWKLIAETRRILELPKLRVAATAVRVPVFSAHSESVCAEFGRQVSPKEARAALYNAEGVVLEDEPRDDEYPMPFPAGSTDDVWVGRIRQDPDDLSALHLWVVADNLRKGAALNAVQIAELLHDELA